MTRRQTRVKITEPAVRLKVKGHKPIPAHRSLLDVAILRGLEQLMATVADIQGKQNTLQTTLDEILDTLKHKPPPVATQDDLDGIAAAVDNAQATADQIKPLAS